MTISKEILENLDTSYIREPKRFKKKGELKETRHMGSYRATCEVVGHSWEYRKGQNKGETTLLFGRKKCDTVFPPKVIAVVHIIAIDGKRRQVPVNDLSVELNPETDETQIPAVKKVKAVNDGRRFFKVGSAIPVRSDVWEDGYIESYFDSQTYKKQQKGEVEGKKMPKSGNMWCADCLTVDESKIMKNGCKSCGSKDVRVGSGPNDD